MKNETREWIEKADGDFYDAQRGIRARTNRNPDGVCFARQQCIEKYLKGCLEEAAIAFPRTHDLSALTDLLPSPYDSLGKLRADLELLTDYAVAYRYPGERATDKQAKEAFKKCRALRAKLREALGLEDTAATGAKRARTRK